MIKNEWGEYVRKFNRGEVYSTSYDDARVLKYETHEQALADFVRLPKSILDVRYTLAWRGVSKCG